MAVPAEAAAISAKAAFVAASTSVVALIAGLVGILTAFLTIGFLIAAIGITGAGAASGSGATAAPPVRLANNAATLGSELFY